MCILKKGSSRILPQNMRFSASNLIAVCNVKRTLDEKLLILVHMAHHDLFFFKDFPTEDLFVSGRKLKALDDFSYTISVSMLKFGVFRPP